MRQRSSTRGAAGFTLIELLVVSSIISILMALGVAGYTKARNWADRTASAHTMRMLGVAIQMYAVDNDNTLPGPLYNTQNAWYKKNNTSSLGYRLYNYLGSPAPKGTDQECKALLTPAFVRMRPKSDSPQYLIQTYIDYDGNPSQMPFGYPGSADNPNPWKLAMISMAGITQKYAVQEIDAEHPRVQGWSTAGMAPKPVLGDVRMTLFFDWHVEAIPADQTE
ncbi:MAG: hypothetical protein B9S32_14815 [Verrucomicrobia bacterium Tous-C9LFEB]|nr:MAG: hypothetical protein B9S32_14815 [Verrucomicrobia bacterium Tous-C9LFEB]